MKKGKNKNNGKVLYILNIIISILIVIQILALQGVFVKEWTSDSSINLFDSSLLLAFFSTVPLILIAFVLNILLICKDKKIVRFIFLIPTILCIVNVFMVFNNSNKKVEDKVEETITCVKDGKEKEYRIKKDSHGKYYIGSLEEEWMNEEDDFHGKTDTKSSAKIIKDNLSEIYSRHGGSCK